MMRHRRLRTFDTAARSSAAAGRWAPWLSPSCCSDNLLGRSTPRRSPVGVAAPKAKAVICLFQHGGPSQMDLFDPKPELTKQHGKPYPGELEVHFDKQQGNLLGSPFKFAKHGQSRHRAVASCCRTPAGIVDDITLVRSMTTESVDHESALRLIHSGKFLAGRPTWGSWVIVRPGHRERRTCRPTSCSPTPAGCRSTATRNWSSGLAAGRSTRARRSAPGDSPVLNLADARRTSPPAARADQLEFLERAQPRPTSRRHPENSELEARHRPTSSSPPGCRRPCPRCSTSRRRPRRPASSTGSTTRRPREYGTRCLLARRLVERGVRFVQIFLSGQPWDTHSKNAESLKGLCAMTDQPSAGAGARPEAARPARLDDRACGPASSAGCRSRRAPTAATTTATASRSGWPAAASRRGYVHGATDDFGYKAVEDVVTRPRPARHAAARPRARPPPADAIPHDGRDDSLTDADVTKAA